MARPRTTLTAKELETVREASSHGVREADLARRLGMSYDTWRKLRESDPKARAVWEEAKSLERDSLVGKLYQLAMERDNASAAMFLLKARHGYRDIGPEPGDASPRVSVVVNLPPALTPAEFEKLVKAYPKKSRAAQVIEHDASEAS